MVLATSHLRNTLVSVDIPWSMVNLHHDHRGACGACQHDRDRPKRASKMSVYKFVFQSLSKLTPRCLRVLVNLVGMVGGCRRCVSSSWSSFEKSQLVVGNEYFCGLQAKRTRADSYSGHVHRRSHRPPAPGPCSGAPTTNAKNHEVVILECHRDLRINPEQIKSQFSGNNHVAEIPGVGRSSQLCKCVTRRSGSVRLGRVMYFISWLHFRL